MKKPAATAKKSAASTAKPAAGAKKPAAAAKKPATGATKKPATGATKKPATGATKKPAGSTAAKRTTKTRAKTAGQKASTPTVAPTAPERLATAAQNAQVAADLVTVPAIDHSPDLTLGGVDAPVELPVVDEAPNADDVAAAPTAEDDATVDEVPAAEDVPAPDDAAATHEVSSGDDSLPVIVSEQTTEGVAETDVPAEAEQSQQAAVMVPVADAVATVPKQPEKIALQVSSLTKSFGGQRVVDAIDLTVPAGTFYGIVGPNGAGKTTTLSMIAGLLKADDGAITVDGIDARRDPRAARRLIGVLPDRLRTFDRLTGKQLLSYFGALRGLPSRTIDQRVADLARAFDLTEALGRVVSDYSAGMTKKVMMAGALIHSPRLLILDEPFESVDPVSSAVILDILTAYVNNGGTVILSSHGMDLVERVCSRLAVIVAGQVLAEGTIEDVRGGVTLEQRFVELSGGVSDAEGLEWLHTYSA
ncbi:ATP-binding cassette domain-containing protein [Microbacterium sp. NC79]|uniref:ABC transporter ATP-binding protein n=1 Tax=Microbacterium sp. NC79 TaxID=2851009 RepID=UPI00349F6FBD